MGALADKIGGYAPLFTHRIILSGVMMAMTALITLVGFERWGRR